MCSKGARRRIHHTVSFLVGLLCIVLRVLEWNINQMVQQKQYELGTVDEPTQTSYIISVVLAVRDILFIIVLFTLLVLFYDGELYVVTTKVVIFLSIGGVILILLGIYASGVLSTYTFVEMTSAAEFKNAVRDAVGPVSKYVKDLVNEYYSSRQDDKTEKVVRPSANRHMHTLKDRKDRAVI